MGPRQKQYLSLEEGYDEADFDAPMLDAEDQQEETKERPSLESLAFIGSGNNSKLVKDSLIEQGYQMMTHGMQFSDKYRFKWVQTPAEINYMTFTEGKHICNHFSNANVLTRKLSTLEQI